MESIEQVFGTQDHVSWGQECARAVLIFIYGLFLVRLAGRRMFGKWSALDIIVSIIIGSNLSRALTGNAPLFGTLAASTALVLLHWVFAYAAARSRGFSRLVEGFHVDLGKNGELDRKAVRRWAVSEADINEALRQEGLEDVSQTRALILEPSGKISILKPQG